LEEFQYGGNPNNVDTDGDCIHDGDEKREACNLSLDISLAIQTTDADLDGVSDNLSWGCTALTDGTVPTPNTENEEEEEEETGPFRDDALSGTPAKIFLGMIILAAISLTGAGILMLVRRKKEAAGNVLLDDASDYSEEVWQDSTAAPTGSVILDGTSVGDNADSVAREVTEGRHDGVFGAPQLDGYDFPNWSPKDVQAALDMGWTVEQLREKYDAEQ